MAETLELVQKSLIPVTAPTEHVLRLQQLTGISRTQNTKQVGAITLAQEKGFTLWVDEAMTLQFRYCANVVTRPINARFYKGDMPRFALDRLEGALRVMRGTEQDPIVTIHSNEPMPVAEIDLRPIDPVMVAWLTHPHIVRVGTYCVPTTPAIGFVIAMWDMDKELSLDPVVQQG